MNVTFDGSEWRHGEHTKELVVEKYLSTDKGRRQNTEDISSTVGWSRSFKVFLCRCMIHFTSVIYLESKSWSATYWVWQCEKHLVVLKIQVSTSSKVKDGKEGKFLSRLSFSSGQLYLWNTKNEFKRLCTTLEVCARTTYCDTGCTHSVKVSPQHFCITSVKTEPKFKPKSPSRTSAFYFLTNTFLNWREEKCFHSGGQFSILQILTVF